MNEDFNINKVVAGVVNKQIENAFKIGNTILKGAKDHIYLHLNNTYKRYLEHVAKNYSRSRSFFIRDEPTYIYNFYVPVGLSVNKQTFQEAATIKGITDKNKFAIITGTAGSGKTILLRHLLINAMLSEYKVPIFIELRDFNNAEINLQSFIVNTLHNNGFDLDEKYIEKALKEGHFIIFLDGFDEVDATKKKELSRQIQEFSMKFIDSSVILSSRPDNEFARWTQFLTLEIMPLNLKQACELIQKLDFDPDLKKKFLFDLKNNLYEKHKTFLSNPLLLSILLLTYELSADIPNKMTIFYNQAYEALFQRHDARKGAYQRKKLTSLDIREFQNTFSAFSIQTYDKRDFRFTKTAAIEYLDNAKIMTNLNFDSENYLADVIQAVCLLIEDGLNIAYAHRSFQEYFASLFIASKPEMARKLLSKFKGNIISDNIFRMLYEIAPTLLEKEFILPELSEMVRDVTLDDTGYLKWLTSMCDEIQIERPDVAAVTVYGTSEIKIDRVNFLFFIRQTYREQLNWGISDTVEHLIKYVPEDKKDIHLRVRQLTISDPIFQDLKSSGFMLSAHTLKILIDAQTMISSKVAKTQESLKQILLS